MKKALSIILAVALAVSCSFTINSKLVRGNGVEATRSYDLPAFTAIHVAGSMDVFYTQGPQGIILTTDENLLDLYTIESLDNTLKISTKSGYSINPKTKSYVTVSSEDLNAVKIAGSGECDIKGTLDTKGDFNFSVSGSGDLDADAIVCNAFTAKVNGSGDIEIGLKDAGSIQARINGSGDISLSGSARSLDSHVNGSGGIHTSRLQLRD